MEPMHGVICVITKPRLWHLGFWSRRIRRIRSHRSPRSLKTQDPEQNNLPLALIGGILTLPGLDRLEGHWKAVACD